MHEELGGTYLGNKGKVSKMGCQFQFRPMDMQVIMCYPIQVIGVKNGRNKPKKIQHN